MARQVRVLLHMEEIIPDALEKVAAELRQETDGRFRHTLFWRAALVVTQKLNPAGAALVLNPYPLLRIGDIEVLFMQLGSEPCYQVSVEGVLAFEGTLSARLISLLKEFEGWHRKKTTDRNTFQKHLLTQYEQFTKSPRFRSS